MTIPTIPTKQDLLKLRDLTQMTGGLEKSQIAQLKMWPKIILCANDGEIEFNPDEKFLAVDLSNLDYKSMESEGVDIVTSFKRRMDRFDESIKFLLGDDYTVIVKVKGTSLGNFPPKMATLGAHSPKPMEGKFQ